MGSDVALPMAQKHRLRASTVTYEFIWVDSPIGKLKLVAKGDALAGVLWENERKKRVVLEPLSESRGSAVLAQAAQQLDDYFAGRRTRFDLKLDFKGTSFQQIAERPSARLMLSVLKFGRTVMCIGNTENSNEQTQIAHLPWGGIE